MIDPVVASHFARETTDSILQPRNQPDWDSESVFESVFLFWESSRNNTDVPGGGKDLRDL